MDLQAELIAAIAALFGLLVGLAKFYDAVRQRTLDRLVAEKEQCCKERDALKDEAREVLRKYQERDAEELARLRGRDGRAKSS